MAALKIRPAVRDDLPRLTEIYNYYVVNTPITFDIEPVTVESRVRWFDEHAGTKRHRLFVAEDAGFGRRLGRHRAVSRPRGVRHERRDDGLLRARTTGRGIGAAMYRVLIDALKDEDISRVLAGITLPNDASVALHRRFGFTEVGVFTECGRKFGKYWDVVWMERPLRLAGE